MSQQFKILDEQRRVYENEAIKSVLRFFNIPEHKSEALKCMDDFLVCDFICISMPKKVYRAIDFSMLNTPKKLMFQPNHMGDEWTIIGFNQFQEPKIEINFKDNRSETMRIMAEGRW